MREIEMKRSHGSVRALALFAYISVIITSLSGCKDDKDSPSAHMGKVRLSLSADTTSLKKGIHSSVTKAVSDEFADFLTVDDYRILVVAGTDTAKQYDRFDKMPAEFELPEGTYSLIASKGNNLPAEYENPYFEGSTDFTVKEGMSSPLDVTCSLGNTRIMAEYTDDFKEAYSEYTVLLSSANTTADFEIAKGETRPAYMQVAKDGTDIAVGIRLKKVNAEEEKTYYVPNAIKMERRQNVRLIFKTDGEALEGIGLDVMLDDSLATQSFTTKIPDFMWQQFEKPTLSPTEFKSGDKFELRSGLFTRDPYIGINMPGGIGSLIIKYWREGEQEEDATVYDLATDAGVKAAKEQHYTWFIGEDEDLNVSKKKVAVLHLQGGLNSLPSSLDKTYTYHYKVYGTDATGKANESNIVSFDVDVLPADAPQIVAEPASNDPYEIVEGDELSTDWKLEFTATGLIDEYETKIVVNDGESDTEYYFVQDQGESLKLSYGAVTEIVNNANAVITIPKSFSKNLSAPVTGGTVYTFTFYLKDQNGNKHSLKKTITVLAPEFTFETTENDAFARRIVLRVNTSGKEDKKHLSFEYRPNGEPNWLPVESSGLKDLSEKSPIGQTQYVDTLKGINPETEYSIRVVYNANTSYPRRSSELSLTTEVEQGFRNGKLVDPLNDWSIASDRNSSTLPGYDKSIIFAIGNISKGVGPLGEPYRCWEIWNLGTADVLSDWNTLNILTTSEGDLKNNKIKIDDLTGKNATKAWARYVANSGTIKSDGITGNAALIRTVGWGVGSGAAFDLFNIWEVAASVKKATPGELYLGSYNEGAQYGIPFTSRPSGFSFYYKYENLMGSSDTFTAEIVVKDKAGDDIVVGKFTSSVATSSWKKQVVHLDYKQEAVKANTMYIRFVSGANRSNEVSDFPVKPAAQNVSNGEYTGSHLYIDNVELIYE